MTLTCSLWMGKLARFAFLVGIALLLLPAVTNIQVSFHFFILNLPLISTFRMTVLRQSASNTPANRTVPDGQARTRVKSKKNIYFVGRWAALRVREVY
jgi:hypothetical protein